MCRCILTYSKMYIPYCFTIAYVFRTLIYEIFREIEMHVTLHFFVKLPLFLLSSFFFLLMNMLEMRSKRKLPYFSNSSTFYQKILNILQLLVSFVNCFESTKSELIGAKYLNEWHELPPLSSASNILEAKNYVNESFFSWRLIKVVVKSFVLIYNTLLNY